MKSRVGSKGFWIAMTILLLFILYWGTGFLLVLKQQRDKAAVRQYIGRVQPMLAADPRFKEVRFMGYSCDNVMYPYMPIFGTVSSQEDWDALDNLIRTCKPPVSIWVREVRVVPDHAMPKVP
jgi:hypothetical protein